MRLRVRAAIIIAILLWASAFMGIRIGLEYYSPQGMALLRFIVAAICMAMVYFAMPTRNRMTLPDKIALMLLGGVSIGLYNLFLNFGELTVLSGTASFITSQSPIIAALFAALLLGEGFSSYRVAGFIISITGTFLIALGEAGELKFSAGMMYLLIATLAGSLYSVLQKPYLKKYHAIEVTTYVLWGCALCLIAYFPMLKQDISHAELFSTLAVIYLGIFPAAIGYIAWSYALTEISATRAMNYLYFMPFVATFFGWFFLHEIPMKLTLFGGALAMFGVMVGNYTRNTRS